MPLRQKTSLTAGANNPETDKSKTIMALGCAETTLRRTAQEEEADEQEILQNFLDKKYNDWPNEAGVSDPATIFKEYKEY